MSANNCRCGCGLPAAKLYLRGHDARHAGIVARAAAKQDDPMAEENFAALPSDALRAKAKRATAKLTFQAGRTEDGFVRIGRWDYPARRDARGRVTRNTKRDGSGDWVKADAKHKFRVEQVTSDA